MESSDCIVEGLYLGGIEAAMNERDLSDKSISHILSIDESPLPPILTQRFKYKHVYALDLFGHDLLSFFADTFVFIEQAKNAGGNVLVHCQAGMSRSATIVAAYLMQKMSITKNKALELITSSRPFVRPNDTFMDQLDLFEKMGCELIKTHKCYRAYKLSILADKFRQGNGALDCEVPSDLLIHSDFAVESNDAYYKCRKCRMILFRHGAITNHALGIGESAFDWRGQGPSKHYMTNVKDDHEICSRSLFVDPLQWMKGKINTVSGKIHCPQCDIKLGSFVWFGEKCPCGAWVAPAFHINNGKVDKIPFQTVAPQASVPAAGASMFTAGPPQSRPVSAFSNLTQRQPLIGQGSNFADGRLMSQTCHGKPIAMVAAVAPHMASHDAPSTSGMEMDELSLAVGTSSLVENAISAELRDSRPECNVSSMDVDS